MQNFQQDKPTFHPRNKHKGRYDFKQLIHSCPELAPFVVLNKYKSESIDFSDPKAVKMINTALLMNQYALEYWNVPEGYLCPPIPGRADYIHHVADLLASINKGKIPNGAQVKCLDVGVGANCIYPIIGAAEYGWSFVGSDIDMMAIASAQEIVDNNPSLQGKIELRLQKNPKRILRGVLKVGEKMNVIICNPPFHASAEEAQSGTLRKLTNLNKKKVSTPSLNFGGQNNELWCEGGELQFIKSMISESMQFTKSCDWFTTLVSKQSNLKSIYSELYKAQTTEIKTIEMGQGNKVSRVVAWRY